MQGSDGSNSEESLQMGVLAAVGVRAVRPLTLLALQRDAVDVSDMSR